MTAIAREAEIVARSAFAAVGENWSTLLHAATVVSLLGTDASEQEIAAAWLHDVVEDTQLTLDDLVDIGFPDQIVAAVNLLTRQDGETYHDYKNRLTHTGGPGGKIARRVKLADARHNLARCQQAAAVPKWKRLAEERYEPMIATLAPIVAEEAEA